MTMPDMSIGSETHTARILGALGARRDELLPQVLALGNRLQTTLDLDELIHLFHGELTAFVPFDALIYRLPDTGEEILKGNPAEHNLRYNLRVQDNLLGEIRFSRARPFSGVEIEILENLLAALLYPLRNSLLYRAALHSALTDPLTGLHNRAAMDTLLIREVKLAQRKSCPLTVILADIDHFKSINDGYGHLVGDHCLQAVAHTLDRSIRDSDLVFRYGGEEFLIVLGQTNLRGARLLAERIRREVMRLHVPGHPEHGLSISLGAAQLDQEEDWRALCERADKALYRAKQAGRNRVETA